MNKPKYKVGDICYDRSNGKATIEKVDFENRPFVYFVRFENGTVKWSSEDSLRAKPFPRL